MILIHLIKTVVPLKETESIGEKYIWRKIYWCWYILEPADLHDVSSNESYCIFKHSELIKTNCFKSADDGNNCLKL